jgi:ferritin-like metal-binding protein YciE
LLCALLAWAERLNDRQSARLLRRSLEEKRGADAMLGQIAAASINHCRSGGVVRGAIVLFDTNE